MRKYKISLNNTLTIVLIAMFVFIVIGMTRLENRVEDVAQRVDNIEVERNNEELAKRDVYNQIQARLESEQALFEINNGLNEE